jgi:hypothetical protein
LSRSLGQTIFFKILKSMPSKRILFNPNPTLSVEVFTFDCTLCYFPIPPQFCNHFSTFYALGLLETKENTLETSIPDSIHRTFDWGLHKHWNTAIFHDQIQRIGTLVFVALVNERTEIKRWNPSIPLFDTKVHGQVEDVYFGCNKYSYWNIIVIYQIHNSIDHINNCWLLK